MTGRCEVCLTNDELQDSRAFIEEHERLILAMGQAPHVLWEVDIPDRSYHIYDIEKAAPDDRTAMENFPECFFERGMVHPDSEEAFRGFAGALLNGSTGGAGNFIMRNSSGSRYEWVSFSYRMTYDSAGSPLKAIGIQEKLPSVSGTMFSAFSRRTLPEQVRYHLLSRISASLTEDSVENLWFGGGNYSQWARGLSYTDIIAQREKRLFARGELRAFEEDFHRETLLNLYRQGIRWFSKDYRRIDNGGNIRTMNGTAGGKTVYARQHWDFVWRKCLPLPNAVKQAGRFFSRSRREILTMSTNTGILLCALCNE